MPADRREQIQQSLRTLVQTYRSMMDLMEKTLALLNEEFALDPLTYFQTRPTPAKAAGDRDPVIDRKTMTVSFGGKTCFLGYTYPFRLLARLAQRPNTYVSYEELLADVWDGGVRSDDAIRSAVARLRSQLRRAGMAKLADAIDGSSPGHYALKLSS